MHLFGSLTIKVSYSLWVDKAPGNGRIIHLHQATQSDLCEHRRQRQGVSFLPSEGHKQGCPLSKTIQGIQTQARADYMTLILPGCLNSHAKVDNSVCTDILGI